MKIVNKLFVILIVITLFMTAITPAGDVHADSGWINLGGATTSDTNGQVTTVVTAPNGDVYAAGYFTVIGGVSANYIARWDGEAWNSLGSGVNNTVKTLAIGHDGDLYAGGNFTTAGGVSAAYIAKWDGANWSPVGNGTNGSVNSIAFDSAGNLYVGGSFTRADGTILTANRIAVWNGASWASYGTGMNSTVYALVVDSEDNLYAGGGFTTVNGVGANRVAKFNGVTWSGVGTGTNNIVLALTLDGSDNLYAGGLFTTAGGVTSNYLARWNGSSWESLLSGLNDRVTALDVDSSGNLYIGGWFTASNTAENSPYFAKWDQTSWVSAGASLDNRVYGINVAQNDDVYISGDFTANLVTPTETMMKIAKFENSAAITSPIVTVTKSDESLWTTSDVTVTIDATGDATPLQARYQIDTGSWTEYTDVPVDVIMTSNGTISYEVKNNINMSTTGETIVSNIDKDAPILGFAGAQDETWLNVSATITPDSSDTLSGLVSQYISTDGATWVSSLEITEPTTIYCQATDLAGNIASDICGTVNVDITAPANVTSANETNGIVTTQATQIFNPSFTWEPSTDGIGSGVVGYHVYFGNNPNGTSSYYVSSPSYAVTDATISDTGLYYLKIQAVDGVGNLSAWKQAFVLNYVPSDVPVLSSVLESNGLTNAVWQNYVSIPSFTWVKPDVAVTQYGVYFGTDSEGTSATYQDTNSYTANVLPETGTYYMRVQSKTINDRVSSWNTVFTINYDIDTPTDVAYPLTENTGAINNVCQAVTKSPSFTWTRPDDIGSGIVGYNYYWTKDANMEPAQATVMFTNAESLSFPASEISGGVYYLFMQSVDGAGNTSGWTINYVYCYALGDTVVTTETDGQVVANLPSANSTIQLDLPAGMSTDPLKVVVYEGSSQADDTGNFKFVGNSFNIEATSLLDSENIHTFDKEYTITLSYTPEQVVGIDIETLKIYYHNPDTDEWEALATSVVDTVNHTVTATIDHMSEYALIGDRDTNFGNVDVTITGDTYGFNVTVIDFGEIVLNGALQNVGSTPDDWQVADPTGTGDGWTMSIQATIFSDGTHSIPADNMQFRLIDTTIETVAGNIAPYSTVTDWTLLSTNARNFMSANIGDGMGTYTFNPEFTLAIPADAYAGSYSSTIYIQMVAGVQ